MPLHKLEKNSDGLPVLKRTEAGLVESWTAITLEGEMSGDKDFSVGCVDWLYCSFDENVLHYDGHDQADKIAEFLSIVVKGPYYLYEGPVNNHITYSLVLLDSQDVESFSREFPTWHFDADAIVKNKQLMKDGLQRGVWQPACPRLQKYCHEQLLYPATSAQAIPKLDL